MDGGFFGTSPKEAKNGGVGWIYLWGLHGVSDVRSAFGIGQLGAHGSVCQHEIWLPGSFDLSAVAAENDDKMINAM